MPAPYSNDLRKKVISVIKDDNQTISSAAKRFNVSYDFVYELWNNYKIMDSIEPKKVGGHTKPKVDSIGEEQIKQWLTENPSFTLEALCDKYEQNFQKKLNGQSFKAS
jgi:transposase